MIEQTLQHYRIYVSTVYVEVNFINALLIHNNVIYTLLVKTDEPVRVYLIVELIVLIISTMGKDKLSSAPAANPGGIEFPADKPKKPPNKRMLRMGATVSSRGPLTTSDGIVVKEWQRLPKQILLEYCQSQKLNKPIFAASNIHTHNNNSGDSDSTQHNNNTSGGKFRIRCIIPDKKGNKSNDINVVSNELFSTVNEAEHMTALLMLHTLNPKLPHDKKLPPPYDIAWKSLSTGTPSVSSNSRYTTQSDKQQQYEQSRAKQNKSSAIQLHVNKQYHVLQMSEPNQQYIENIIKVLQLMEHQSTQHRRSNHDQFDDTEIVKQLNDIGFDESDIRSALTMLRSRNQLIDIDTCIEHLLLNTPESRLPKRYTQQKKTDFKVVSNSVDAAGTLLGVLRQCIPNKLIDVYSKQRDNVYDVCTLLYRDIYNVTSIANHDSVVEIADRIAQISEELSVLESIYDTSFKQHNTDTTVTQWSVQQHKFSVTFIVSAINMYPTELPVIVLSSNAHQLSASQLMYITQCIKQHIIDQQLIGHTVSYHVIQYLSDQWDDIINMSLDTQFNLLPSKWQKYIRSVQLNQQQIDSLHQSHSVQVHLNQSKKSQNQHNHNKNTSKIINKLYDEYQSKQQSKEYQAMIQQRSQLPVYSRRDELLPLIRAHQLVIVDAQTGSGKSTQLPQLILDDCISNKQLANIICTQPRRISAIGLAGRVSDERCESLGHTVGYRVRLDNKVGEYTCLTYVTVGILLQQLINSTSELSGVTHIVIDEIHERSVDIDLVLLLVKQILKSNNNIKVVLMSATLTAGLYHQYFHSVISGTIPMLSIAGRMFDVQQMYLEDIFNQLQYKLQQRYCIQLSAESLQNKIDGAKQYYNNKQLRYDDQTIKQVCVYNQEYINYELIEQLIFHLIQNEINTMSKQSERHKSGILVFVPGVGEINRLQTSLESHLQNTDYTSRYTVIPLHSQLSNQQQSLVFKQTNTTKIVLSTNIAETSITVNDIIYVIDTGKSKQNQYNSITDISSLTEQWITKSNSIQRAGRAGRVQSGTVYRLYTHELYDKLEDQPIPEIKRINLEHICLQLTHFTQHTTRLDSSVIQLLSNTIDPPTLSAIQHSINTLVRLGALDQQEQLTPLGQHLTALPVNNVKIGKLLLYGNMLQCMTTSVCIAAILSSNKSLLTQSNNESTVSVQHNKSDYLYQYQWYKLWYQTKHSSGGTSFKARQYAQTNGLNDQTCDMIESIVQQYIKALIDIKFLNYDFQLSLLDTTQSTLYDINNNNIPMITSVLCSSLYPNVIKVKLPQAKYQSTAHGSVPIDSDAKSIKYYIKQLPDALQDKQSITIRSDTITTTQHTDQRVFIHPRSVNYNTTDYDCPYLLYNSIQSNDSGKISIFDCSVSTAYSYLLLSNSTLTVDHNNNLLLIDDYIKFRCNNTKVIILIKQLRHYLNVLFHNKITDPSLSMNSKTNPVLDAIQRLISTNGF